jgi:hypothetical protein
MKSDPPSAVEDGPCKDTAYKSLRSNFCLNGVYGG